MTINFGGDFANSARAHSLIEPFGIRVGGNLDRRDVIPGGCLHCMNEEFFTDACADMFGSNPHVFEFGPLSDNQSVETNNYVFTLCHIDRIVGNEIGGDGEVVLPMLNPMLGIAPMPFGVVSDLRSASRRPRPMRVVF